MSSEENNKNQVTSGNKLLSDNTIKNALFNVDIDFGDLKEMFFSILPKMREEVLIRYRGETIKKIGYELYKILENENIPVKPIPYKIAVPLIEKMSLEQEPDMYEKWAKLLLAASVNPNPIHQQYTDLLAKLDSHSANFLKNIYTQQKNPYLEDEYEEHIEKINFRKYYDTVWKKPEGGNTVFIQGRPAFPDTKELLHTSFDFPFVIYGTEEKTELNMEDNQLVFITKEHSMLLNLEKLGLIKYHYFSTDTRNDENSKSVDVERCGMFLTNFGYSFVDCLEHPIK